MPNSYLLYDFDMGELATTTVYDDYDEVAIDARLDNVMIVTVPSENFARGSAPQQTPHPRPTEDKMKLYLWKDRHDGDMIQLGVEASTSPGGRRLYLQGKKFYCWGQMHVDGVGEVFGEAVKHALSRETEHSKKENRDEEPICVEADSISIFRTKEKS